MERSRERKKQVYIAWKRVFSSYDNSHLRRQKAIRAVVQKHRPNFDIDPDLIEILQSLLQEGVFQSKFEATRLFPELFCAQETTLSAPAIAAVTQVSFGMEGPSKELMSSLKSPGLDYIPAEDTQTSQYLVATALIEYIRPSCVSDLTFSPQRVGQDLKNLSVNNFNQEALEGNIVLEDDDPRIVGMMLDYLYCLDYDCLSQYAADSQTSLTAAEDGDERKLQGFVQVRQSCAEILLHAQVYILADKYMISCLKDLALQKFETAARQRCVTEDILAAAHLAYAETTEADRGLRDAIIAAIYEHPDILDEKETQNLLRETGALGLDLIIYLRRNFRF